LVWIEAQENAWDALEGSGWAELGLNGAKFDPLEVEEINRQLLPQGLAYGAGFSRGLVPTCFLGELAELRQAGEITILVLGTELARDLEGAPALSQGNLIYARRQTMAYYLWDHLADPSQQNNRFLKIALPSFGLPYRKLLQQPDTYRDRLEQLLEVFLAGSIRHEIGEILETTLRPATKVILEHYAGTKAELFARGLKDALAEVHEAGRLAYFIEHQDLAGLALMLAWQPGFYPLLLPEVEPAFWELAASRNWQGLERARKVASVRLRLLAADLNDFLFSLPSHPAPNFCDEIQRRYLLPLGL
jgi:hypothetical protein